MTSNTIWEKNSYNAYQKQLFLSSDEKYKTFNEKLLVSSLPTIGIRLPVLRKKASEIAKNDPAGFLEVCGSTYHEERMLYALVAASLSYTDFLPHSDRVAEVLTENWAICDTFCNSLKKVLSGHKADYFQHITKYLASQNPWAVRVGIVVMLFHYLEEDTITEVLRRTCTLKSDFYYVQMAQAWLLATAWGKHREKTKEALFTYPLSPITFRRFVQKARESYRVSPEDKAYLKSLLSAKTNTP